MCGVCLCVVFCFKQKTAYEMRISDWSSDVCSSDLLAKLRIARQLAHRGAVRGQAVEAVIDAADRHRDHFAFELAQARGRQHQVVVHVREAAQLLGVEGVADRKSVVTGKSVSVRVDLGGRRIIKKKKNNIENT